MNPENPALQASVLVVCLCAEWCGVCRDYRSRFAEVQSRFPQARFLWIDVEEEADLLHPLDVEDFPTLLIAVGDAPRFFGPLTPQVELLERLIRAQIENATAPALANRSAADLVARVRAAKEIPHA
jgi:thiol-disulfide isomerase/thioredoxin